MLPAPIGLPNPDVPPNAELSDLDLAVLEEIRKLDALLDKIRKLDPALHDKIRKFDPDVLDELRKIDPALLDGLRKIHPTLLDDPTLLDELRKVDPAVLQEMQLEPAERDPAIIGAIRKLYLKLREEDEEVAERSTCSGRQTANGNQKTQSEETDGGGGEDKNENGGDVEMKVGEERSRSQHYPVRPEAGEGKTGRKNRKNNRMSMTILSDRGKNDDVPPKSGKNGVVPLKSGKNDVVPYPELSDGDLELLKKDRVLNDKIRTLDLAVLDDLLKIDPVALDALLRIDHAVLRDYAELDPAIIDAIRKLCLKRKEEDEQEAKGSCCGRETKSENKNGNETQIQERDEEISRSHHYLRPEDPDCSYYRKTGTSKFRSNCKFKQPRTTTKNNQDYFWSGERKDGRDGSFNPRSREPSAAPFVENFMGLPINPGERDCSYYMRNLSCRYGLSCRFNHPDPTPAGESEPPSGYVNGGPASLQGASSSTAARWSEPRSLNNAPLIIPPSQGISSRNTEHIGYQQQQVEELPQRPGQPVCIYFSTTGDCNFKSNCKYHHPKNQTAVSPSCALNDKGLPLRPQQQVEELPQRPGQPVCIYFSTTGDCNFKSNCKYHHPKNQTAVSPSCALNDKGLPLRPGQNICTQYSSYGICNSGPACEFDHPSL